MPFYYHIDGATPDGQRTAQGLLRLREQLKKEVPLRSISDTLLLATWNIREFDSEKYGPRLPEAYYYIAEIISHFDLIAIQEVREDLSALNQLKRILGGWWSYLVTDVTEGKPGNRERLAFFYDQRKVGFAELAGEVVIPPIAKGKKEYEPAKQLARTPYICGFRAGWSNFNLCTVHILYGESKPEDPKRIEEINAICQFLAKRAKEVPKKQTQEKDTARTEKGENIILLGDFNIFSPTDKTMQAILNAGFTVPPELQSIKGSNVEKNKHYDQIAFMKKELTLDFMGNAGIFDYYESVFRNDDQETYLSLARTNYETAKGKKLAANKWPGKGFSEWRTYQMSDHLPMWIELKIDFGKEYLEKKTKATT
jgi:endonuclease/exonuclease/phosphatase family metal-dependent hydrolase